VFVDIISVSAVLYIINFANCYQNGPIKARKEAKERRERKESNYSLFGEYTRKIIGVSGKLRTLYNLFFIMKRLGKGCFGRFGTHYGYFHYFLWEK
jgi:hypothetical protein